MELLDISDQKTFVSEKKNRSIMSLYNYQRSQIRDL